MICINQVGYRPQDAKVAVASGALAGKAFRVIRADGSAVLTGVFGAAMHDPATDSDVCRGDFSALTAPGNYCIAAEGEQSYPFAVAENVYDEISKSVLRMLFMQRCGCALSREEAGDFAHPPCHHTPALIWGTTRTRNVNGGWHDAGDYGRYVVPGAKTVADMLLLYELCGNSMLATCQALGLPEQGNGLPDLLNEARFELDWMLRMQDEATGGVYHKVSCRRFPGMVMPHDETDELVLSPISDAATADFAAVMAKAAVDFAPLDAPYAQRCKATAEQAWAYLMALDHLTGFDNPEGIYTGSYRDDHVEDELFFAAAELLACARAFGEAPDPRAQAIADQALAEPMYPGLGWAGVAGYGYFTLGNALGDTRAKAILLDGAEKILALGAQDGYGCSMGTRYPWGSNMNVANHGMLLLMCDHLQPDARFRAAAKAQLDVLLGVNGMNFCYVSGFGMQSMRNPHHRPSQAVGHAVPGMLAGGPNMHIQDAYAREKLAGQPPALCYVDHHYSYATNEIAIYWNSPLIFLLGAI